MNEWMKEGKKSFLSYYCSSCSSDDMTERFILSFKPIYLLTFKKFQQLPYNHLYIITSIIIII